MITNKITTAINSRGYSYLALFSLYAYTLTVIPFEGVSKFFHVTLVLLSLPVLFTERKAIFKDPMVILLGIALVVQLLSWTNSIINYSDFANGIPKFDRLGKLFLFIFIAYWLKGNVKYTYITLSCFIISIILGFMINSSDFFHELSQGFQGSRIDFSVKNAQFTSMFSGIGLIVSLFLLFQIKKNKSHNKIISIILLINFSLFFTITTIITQSRQVWLALAILIILIPIFIKRTINKGKIKITFIYYVLLLISFIAIFNMDFVQKRTGKESQAVNAIIQGKLDNIPMTNIGARVNSWIEASEWIKENPIVGAGPEAISQVLLRSEKFQSSPITSGLRHLHNYHIETLVAYGVIGLLAIYAMYGWLIKSLIQIKRRIPESRPFLLLAIVFCCFWFIINCFETFNARTYGVFTHNIILGCCYTFYLTHSLQSTKKE